MRKYLRQIAKARMKALGIDRVNRKMRNGAWRKMLTGDMANRALFAQIGRNRPKKRKAGRATA